MSMNNGEVSINELLAKAVEAELQGVPVSWRDLAMQIANAAINEIRRLNEENQKLHGELMHQEVSDVDV